MSTIAIVSPGYPSASGGVRDHTARLVTHWSEAGHKVLPVGALPPSPGDLVADWKDRGVGAALLQYVPFLWGRRGLSRFPEGIARECRSAAIRLSIFVHETWVPPTRLPWRLLSPLQRRQLRRITSLCASVITAVPAWRPLLGARTELVYVGSNLGDPPAPDAVRPLRSPVVFSITAAGLQLDWIAAAVEALGASPGLVVLGTGAEAAQRHPEVGPWFDPAWDWRGHLPSREVLTVLQQAPLVLAPFVDGPTGRRGSLLAALSTGARVLTARGHLSDPVFDRSPVTLAATREEFVAQAVRLWRTSDQPQERARRIAWYREHFDPAALDRRLLQIVLGATA